MNDPFCAEVLQRLRHVPASADPIEALMKVSNQVAAEHPAWYMRFRLWALITRLWR